MRLDCFKSMRQTDCFCSRYDENRQTMFYCGFFTTLAGFIWLVIGFALKCAFFHEAFGPSVNAVACGIMVVGIMVLVLGICATASIVFTAKSNNKTGCIHHSSAGKGRLRSGHHDRREIFFDSPLDCGYVNGGKCQRHESFSSVELNPASYTTSSSTVSSRPSTSSQQSQSYRSDLAMIA